MQQQQIQQEQADQFDQDEDQDEEGEQDEDIVPNSQPPTVPEEGTYIDALNEAGVDPQRIEQLQQSK